MLCRFGFLLLIGASHKIALMKWRSASNILSLVFPFLIVQVSFGQAANSLGRSNDVSLVHSPRLQQIVDRAVKQALEKFADKKLETNQIAVTLMDLTDSEKPAQASYRGGEQVYP